MLWASGIFFRKEYYPPEVRIAWKMFNDQFANLVFSFHTKNEIYK